jgi:hypothetical protein
VRVINANILEQQPEFFVGFSIVYTFAEASEMEAPASLLLLLLLREVVPDEMVHDGKMVGEIEESEAMDGVGEGDKDQVSHNLALECLVHPPYLNSGVMPLRLSVSEIDAKKCADYLTMDATLARLCATRSFRQCMQGPLCKGPKPQARSRRQEPSSSAGRPDGGAGRVPT